MASQQVEWTFALKRIPVQVNSSLDRYVHQQETRTDDVIVQTSEWQQRTKQRATMRVTINVRRSNSRVEKQSLTDIDGHERSESNLRSI